MSSQARRAFRSNSKDIDRLLEIHAAIGGPKAGRRRRLEVLNKSAIVLITSFWEAYCEDIAAEGLAAFVDGCSDPSDLPKQLRGRIARELEEDRHDMAVWRLANDGWRAVLRGRLDELQEKRNRHLNTPKTAQIDSLFQEAIGIEHMSKAWYWSGMSCDAARVKLDNYVELRGSIAHRGKALTSVNRTQVSGYYNHVTRLVGKTGGQVNRAVKQATGKKLF